MNPAEIAHGPILIGFTFNAILLGVMFTQVYLYYKSFKKDKLWIKIFVGTLFGFDILNTACGAAYLYMALIVHFGDFTYLGTVTWLFDTDPAITGFIVTSVQCFFAWRIFVLTKSYIFPGVIVATAVVGGVTAIITPVKVAKSPFFADLLEAKVTIIIWLSAEVLGDILITTILVTFLVHWTYTSEKSKQKTGFQRSDQLVDRIIRITIQTGLITAVVATVNLLVYLLDPTGLHLLFNFPLCKLYSNSLMSTLNSRGVLMSAPAGQVSSHGARSMADDHPISMNHVQSYARPIPPPMKPSDIISYSAKHTEVYVNVESQQVKDNNGLRSNLPLGKGAFDDKGDYSL